MAVIGAGELHDAVSAGRTAGQANRRHGRLGSGSDESHHLHRGDGADDPLGEVHLELDRMSVGDPPVPAASGSRPTTAGAGVQGCAARRRGRNRRSRSRRRRKHAPPRHGRCAGARRGPRDKHEPGCSRRREAPARHVAQCSSVRPPLSPAIVVCSLTVIDFMRSPCAIFSATSMPGFNLAEEVVRRREPCRVIRGADEELRAVAVSARRCWPSRRIPRRRPGAPVRWPTESGAAAAAGS